MKSASIVADFESDVSGRIVEANSDFARGGVLGAIGNALLCNAKQMVFDRGLNGVRVPRNDQIKFSPALLGDRREQFPEGAWKAPLFEFDAAKIMDRDARLLTAIVQ